jgi:hypothetical protein
MKKIISLLFIISFFIPVKGQLKMEYYFPDGYAFNSTIPTPEEVLGFVPGEWHISHDQTIRYFERLAMASDRVILQEYGRTYENRPLFHMIITSPENQKNLEKLRLNHISLADPSVSGNLKTQEMPAVVRLGYGVHGNEASAQNAAPLVAYFYASALGEEIEKILDQTIILIDPSLNPDGQHRFSTWVNMHKSKTLVTDPENREFREVWPGSRTNHYWFDLNRDWILAQHPESKGRLTSFHNWKPLINTDHHEFGANSTFFFQPGIPTRINPLTPKRTNELTYEIGKFHAVALDKIGSLYYTEESFDDFYYGKGSSYPDGNGSIGILFEQAGTKGHSRETIHGVVDFPFTIKNQVTVSFSTIEAAQHLRTKLLENLRDFYSSALQLAGTETTKAWVFGEPHDKSKMYHFLEIMKYNQVAVYELNSAVNIDKKRFEPGNSYIIPLNQPQFRIIQSLFQAETIFEDSLFYDISTWVMPLAFNIPYAAVTNVRQAESLRGKKIEAIALPEGKLIGEKSEIGYLFHWDEYCAPKLLYAIQNKGLRTKVASREFAMATSAGNQNFSYGSIFISTTQQEFPADKIYDFLQQEARTAGVNVYAVSTGLTKDGIDIGSGNFLSINKPEILMLVGDGISSGEAGEIWHLLDQRFHMPVTKVEISRFNNMDLQRYNTIIMPGGSYNAISEIGKNRLQEWIRNGGNLVAMRTANNWLVNQKILSLNFIRATPEEIPENIPYYLSREYRGARNIPGSIFEIRMDISHPIAYGYKRNQLPVFKSGSMIVEKGNNPFANPLVYTNNPLLSGYVHNSFLQPIQGSSSIVISSQGRGNIITFVDNPNFRAFWYGTNKLFMNAIFFGTTMRN